MTTRIAEMSPRLKARIAGAVYLISGMAYSFARNDVRGRLVVDGDAAATARNILAHEPLYRLGFAAEIVSAVCYVAVALLLYDMFKPVSRSVSLLAAFFSLAGCTIAALCSLLHLAPLVVLGGAPYLSVLPVDQLRALALLSLELRAQASSIYMVFFGFYCLLIGYLILRSTFLPRLLGAFMVMAGLAYQIFLSPPLAKQLFYYVVAPAGTLGELSLILWLLIVGVNARRWEEQAGASRPDDTRIVDSRAPPLRK
jgi:Domain of unknown function (DUF4386)